MLYQKIFLLFSITFLITSCSHPIIGTGHLKLVDQKCQPLRNKEIQVNNIDSSGYLRSGHLTKDIYVTDQHGLIKFDIEKTANKLVVFLPNVKKSEKKHWNWYWTVSNNDEVYFRFSESPTIHDQNGGFKKVLMDSSPDNPIVIVYPKKKDACNYKNHALDELNMQKAFVPKPKPEFILKLPKFKVEGYGIINTYLDKLMHYEITKSNHIITKKDQKIGLEFGLFVSFSEKPRVEKPTDIYCVLHYPQPGLTNPNTGEIVTKETKCIFKFDDWWILSKEFKEPWQIQSGEWLFQLKHKDTVLLEKSFIVE